MPDSRLDFIYRGSRIIAAPLKGKPTARAFLGKKCIAEAAAANLPAAIASIQELIDEKIRKRFDGVPTAEDYEHAFEAISHDIGTRRLAMLRAHCAARAGDTLDNFPDRTMTAEQLAEAAGYSGYEAANLQYGLLGRRVAELLDYRPPFSDERGEPVWTMALATGVRSAGGRGLWIWTLRPEVAVAVQRLGWDV